MPRPSLIAVLGLGVARRRCGDRSDDRQLGADGDVERATDVTIARRSRRECDRGRRTVGSSGEQTTSTTTGRASCRHGWRPTSIRGAADVGVSRGVLRCIYVRDDDREHGGASGELIATFPHHRDRGVTRERGSFHVGGGADSSRASGGCILSARGDEHVRARGQLESAECGRRDCSTTADADALAASFACAARSARAGGFGAADDAGSLR